MKSNVSIMVDWARMQHTTKGSLAINEETLQHHHLCQHNGQEEDLNKEKNARVNKRQRKQTAEDRKSE